MIPIVRILRGGGGVNQYEHFLPLSITIYNFQLYHQYIIYDFIQYIMNISPKAVAFNNITSDT
jgi:hypothetical protein